MNDIPLTTALIAKQHARDYGPGADYEELLRIDCEELQALASQLERDRARLILELQAAANSFDRAYDRIQQSFTDEALLNCGGGGAAARAALASLNKEEK